MCSKVREHLEEIESLGGMRKAIEKGIPTAKVEKSAAKKQARIDSKEDVIVGVNAFVSEASTELDVRVVDSEGVKKEQIESLAKLKANRDGTELTKCLKNIEKAAKDKSGNLLELCVEAAKARATTGEISTALEKVYGRYEKLSSPSSGIYMEARKDNSHLTQDFKNLIDRFIEKYGRRPRMLVVKMGQDGHDRGAKVIASGFSDLGFDIDLGALFQNPKDVARQAVDNDVHLVGVSSQAAGHNFLVAELIKELSLLGAKEIKVIVGGVIPKNDYKFLKDKGVDAIFGPGTPVDVSAKKILTELFLDKKVEA